MCHNTVRRCFVLGCEYRYYFAYGMHRASHPEHAPHVGLHVQATRITIGIEIQLESEPEPKAELEAEAEPEPEHELELERRTRARTGRRYVQYI